MPVRFEWENIERSETGVKEQIDGGKQNEGRNYGGRRGDASFSYDGADAKALGARAGCSRYEPYAASAL